MMQTIIPAILLATLTLAVPLAAADDPRADVDPHEPQVIVGKDDYCVRLHPETLVTLEDCDETG